jgi:hypothetical protein
MEISAFKNQLTKLTDGLFYMSESDYPFEFIELNNNNPEEIKKEIIELHPPDSPVETVKADDFFNKLIHSYLASGDDFLISTAKNYDKLYSFISNHATEVNIIRCGRIEVGIYIVIYLKREGVTVLKTTSIET